MTNHLPFPKSFPDGHEGLFLRLVLSDDKDFPSLWEQWRKSIAFDEDINYAMLRLMPLLYLRVRAFDISDETTGRIKGIYKLAWFRNHLLLDATARAIDLLQKNGIPVMVLKGVPLLINTYHDLGARFLGDTDILIHPDHAHQAVVLMLENGWNHVRLAFSSPEKFTSAKLNSVTREITFSDEKENELDIHWKLFSDKGWPGRRKKHPMSYEGLLPRSKPLRVGDVSCTAPSDEDTLIHVIVHGAAFNDHRPIRWIADVAWLIRTSPIDWTRVISLTKEFGFEAEVRLAFSYLMQNLSLPIPPSFLEELSQLPLSGKKLAAYYRKANGPAYPTFGNFPVLWYSYWNYESRGRSPGDYYRFLDYLCASWGLAKKRQLLGFILKKYKERLKRRLHP